jgi:CRP/FNR family cyclic AMP-dependent transcriptional regulator
VLSVIEAFSAFSSAGFNVHFFPHVLHYNLITVRARNHAHEVFDWYLDTTSLPKLFINSGGRVQNQETLLSGLSEQDQKIILDRCKRCSVQPRTVIVSQGSSGRDMFIVDSGSLKVSVISGDGKEISFVVLRAGDYFGELSMIDGRRRSATVTAIESSELFVLGHSEYQELLREYPHTATEFLTRLLLTLVNRMRATDQLYQDSVFLDVSSRLAKFLLSTSVESNKSGRRSLDVRLSQYELGTMVNASRESVNKQLRDWEEKGIVDVHKGKITLLNLERLQQKAAGL